MANRRKLALRRGFNVAGLPLLAIVIRRSEWRGERGTSCQPGPDEPRGDGLGGRPLRSKRALHCLDAGRSISKPHHRRRTRHVCGRSTAMVAVLRGRVTLSFRTLGTRRSVSATLPRLGTAGPPIPWNGHARRPLASAGRHRSHRGGPLDRTSATRCAPAPTAGMTLPNPPGCSDGATSPCGSRSVAPRAMDSASTDD